MKGLNSLRYYLGQIIVEGSEQLCFSPRRLTGFHLIKDISVTLLMECFACGRAWVPLHGDGMIRFGDPAILYLGQIMDQHLWGFGVITGITSFLLLFISPFIFACRVVVYISPVYDPGLWVKTHINLSFYYLSLTLLHAVWWSTSLQCMTLAYGLSTLRSVSLIAVSYPVT